MNKKNMYIVLSMVLASVFYGQSMQKVNAEPLSVTEDTVIDAVNFPDQKFREYVDDKFDTTDNGVLDVAEKNAVKKIELNKMGVTNTKGIENFPNLEVLWIKEPAGITMDITKNLNLISLECTETKLSSINISENTNLTKLILSNNELNNLDVTNNKLLTTLYCDKNKLMELNINENTQLTALNVASNDIAILNISHNPLLSYINCSNTLVETINVTAHTNLAELYCESSKITELNLENNAKLKKLTCEDLGLTALDVKNNKELTDLRCSKNKLGQLDVINNTKLGFLRCGENNLTELDLTNNTELYDLSCNDNNLSMLNLSQNTILDGITVNNNKLIALDTSNCPNILKAYSTIDPQSETEIGINKEGIVNLEEYDAKIDGTKIKNLSKGNIVGNTITGLSIGDKITYLYDVSTKNGPMPMAVNIKIIEDNDWKLEVDINDWTYGETASSPVAESIYGEVIFEYRKANDLSRSVVWSTIKPTEAGDYFVRGVVEKGNGYKGLVSPEVPFTIHAKQYIDTMLPEINKDTEVIIKDGSTVLIEGTDYDINKTETGITITFKGNYTGTYEKTWPADPTINTNSWVSKVSIKDWTYGQTTSLPTGKSTYGRVIFEYRQVDATDWSINKPTNAGQYFVRGIVEKGTNFTGLIGKEVPFTIHAKQYVDAMLPEINKDSDIDNLVIKDVKIQLVKGVDYDIAKTETGITITFKGNYTGTYKKSWSVIPPSGVENQPEIILPSDKENQSVSEATIKQSLNTGDDTESSVSLYVALVFGSLIVAAITLTKGSIKKEYRR